MGGSFNSTITSPPVMPITRGDGAPAAGRIGTPRFETGAPEYQWLTRNVFVGTAARHPDRVELAIYQLL